MPKLAEGELRWSANGAVARITLKGRDRKPFALPTCRTKAEAEERKRILADLARRFRRAGLVDSPDVNRLLDNVAACAPALLPGFMHVAGELLGGELEADTKPSVTFGELANDWTEGKLHERFPDHVKAKDSELDATRLEKLGAIDVGGLRLADVPLDQFTLDHAEAAMRQLPKEAKRPATRRQYAQLIHRVLGLAVYPCRIIEHHPLPKGFMPKVGKPPGFSYLYPTEDEALLGAPADKVPLPFRMLWGFLAREGCRSGEAITLRIGHEVDLERGVVSLDKNKTDEARLWAMDVGVAEALRRWAALRKARKGTLLFVDEAGERLENDKLAERLRSHLKAAGVQREELFIPGVNRGQLRVHDLRGTFVTLSLANGRSEAWVADRTGHTSSAMINRYRRAARSATELGLGPLSPLFEAVPELRLPRDYPRATSAGQAGGSQVEETTHKAEVAELADAADSKRARHSRNSEKPEVFGVVAEPQEATAGQSRGNRSTPDPVEEALAEALLRASRAEAWDAVKALTDELRARRAARAGAIDLEAERARRKR
jgi:integrase